MNLLDLNELMVRWFGTPFRRVMNFPSVDEHPDDNGHRRVRYKELDPSALHVQRGLYVIVLNDVDAVYVGSFTSSLAKRWLYLKDKYVYHHQRDKIASALADGTSVSLWLVNEAELQPSIAHELKHFINCRGVESALLANDFEWNALK